MLILIGLLYILAASSFTLAKGILDYAQPFFFIAFRMGIAGVMLLGYWYYNKQSLHIKKEDYKRFLATMLFHIYIAFGCDLVALQYMQSAKGAFLYNFSPFFSALCSYIYFHEKMTIKKWIGLCIGLCGFIPELVIHSPQENNLGSFLFLSWAEIIMLFSVAASVIGWTLVRSLIKDGYSPIVINGYTMLGGAFLALITSLLFESWHPMPVSNWGSFLWLTLLIIMIANIAGYNLQGYLLNYYTGTFLSFTGFLTPFFAALLGWFFLSEPISYHFIFSISVVIIGLIIFYYEELKQGYIIS